MKNFDWTRFTKRIAVKAEMADIYAAWAVPSEIERWFLKTANYQKSTGETVPQSQEVEASDTYEWSWFLYDELERGIVTAANGRDHFQFTFAGNCTVDITLKTELEHTVVELTQINIPTDDESKQNIRLGCSSGWSFYMVNLKSVYEGGLDLRSKDPRLKPMVNN